MKKREIDTIIETLDSLSIKYIKTSLGSVDKYHNYFGSIEIELFKLEYGEFVLFEKLIHHQYDGGGYDEIVIFKFNKNSIPSTWKIEEDKYYDENENDEVPF
jgi:hypothetical protein